ncbi:uncharacterized protein LOC121867863 [Homarus americanus]|uniref:uncharacterized protein LOC121867863 n=1 Tax=Homarus americanus TaxID=6706 RepID=UPI001C438900|nr:uncharacterized protein LOC121867863 [Homarus americanus]
MTMSLVGNVVVVGSCLIPVFDSTKSPPTLIVGGLQLRLRHGLPNPPHGLENLKPSDMDLNEHIPAASVCIRLLPATQDHVSAPPYESGYYRSSDCQPTDTDRRLFRHYIHKEDYKSSTVSDTIKRAQESAGKTVSTDDDELQKYMEETLDWRVQTKKTKAPPPDIDYVHFIHYDIKAGFKAVVLGVFGLPEQLEGHYCHVYCHVLPGKDIEDQPSTPEGHGNDQRFITRNADFLSYQRAPQWLDDPVSLHPYYDEQSILFVQVFGFQPKYLPGNGSSPGKVTTRDGQDVSFDFNEPLAWTFTQIFNNGSAMSGLHWLPLLAGHPDPLLLTSLSESAPAAQVLIRNKSYLKPLDGASIEVKLWDGHLDPLDMREIRLEGMIEAMGNTAKCTRGQIQKFNKTLDEFYLENMDEADKKNGTIGEKFDEERDLFEQEANKVFFKAMDAALDEACYPLLPPEP